MIQLYQGSDKKWIKVNNLSSGQYSVYKNKRLKTLMLSQIYVTTVIYILL